jgi:hypothetical protein
MYALTFTVELFQLVVMLVLEQVDLIAQLDDDGLIR